MMVFVRGRCDNAGLDASPEMDTNEERRSTQVNMRGRERERWPRSLKGIYLPIQSLVSRFSNTFSLDNTPVMFSNITRPLIASKVESYDWSHKYSSRPTSSKRCQIKSPALDMFT